MILYKHDHTFHFQVFCKLKDKSKLHLEIRVSKNFFEGEMCLKHMSQSWFQSENRALYLPIDCFVTHFWT